MLRVNRKNFIFSVKKFLNLTGLPDDLQDIIKIQKIR